MSATKQEQEREVAIVATVNTRLRATGAPPVGVLEGAGLSASGESGVRHSLELLRRALLLRLLSLIVVLLGSVGVACGDPERDATIAGSCVTARDCDTGQCDIFLGICVRECPADTWGADCIACNCDDGQWCNGTERCDARLGCQPGVAPSLDDGVGCTIETCDEAQDSMVSTPLDERCDNGLFCDGEETCDMFMGCRSGEAPRVDDGIGCTIEVCDETEGLIVSTARHEFCDNGLFCDGVERCDAELGCVLGISPVVDDGIRCTVESCDEALDLVTRAPRDSVCDNGLFCDGQERCDAELDCLPGDAPVADDGVGCTVDVCDESVGAIVSTPSDALCDNGLFCDGAERCDAVFDCMLGAPRDLSDGDPCTFDVCDEEREVAAHVALPVPATIVSHAGAFALLTPLGRVLTWGCCNGGDSSGVAEELSRGVVRVHATANAFAALKSDGSVVTWGWAYGGGYSLHVAESLTEVVEIFSHPEGSAFAALRSDGSVVTWGDENKGGDSSAVADALSGQVVDVFSNASSFAALKLDGSIVLWGNPFRGGSWSFPTSPTEFVSVTFNAHAAAALDVNGGVITWGAVQYGGDSDSVRHALSRDVVRVFPTDLGFIALKSDGSAVGWGTLGDWSFAPGLLSGVVELRSNSFGVAALKSDGSVVTWTQGEDWSIPIALSSGVVDVSSTRAAFAALMSDGSVVTWGWPPSSDSSQVSSHLSGGVARLFASYGAFAALLSDGRVVTWGSSGSGGDSSTVADSLLSGVVDVVPGFDAFAALKADGSLVIWGADGRLAASSAFLSELDGALCEPVE